MTALGPVLEVDKEQANGRSRQASSAIEGFQRGAVSASLAAVATYYVNLALLRLDLAPPPEVSFHLDILIAAVCVGGLTAMGKMLRDRGIGTVV